MPSSNQIERIKSHFAGNPRVVFRESRDEVNTYVDGERVTLATMYPTIDTDCDGEGTILVAIEMMLELDRASIEKELHERLSTIPLPMLKIMLNSSRRAGARQVLEARYSVDAEGSHPDEAWTLEQIMRSNPDTFRSDDLLAIRNLAVGDVKEFQGRAWGNFTIRREA